MFLPESRHEEMFFDINLRRGSKETERELTISGSNWSPQSSANHWLASSFLILVVCQHIVYGKSTKVKSRFSRNSHEAPKYLLYMDLSFTYTG